MPRSCLSTSTEQTTRGIDPYLLKRRQHYMCVRTYTAGHRTFIWMQKNHAHLHAKGGCLSVINIWMCKYSCKHSPFFSLTPWHNHAVFDAVHTRPRLLMLNFLNPYMYMHMKSMEAHIDAHIFQSLSDY